MGKSDGGGEGKCFLIGKFKTRHLGDIWSHMLETVQKVFGFWQV